MKIAKPIFTALAVLSYSFFSYTAQANCTVIGNYIHPVIFYYTETIQIDSSLPINSTIGSFRIQSTISPPPTITCAGDAPEIIFEPDRPLYSPGVYETGIPGIGMKVDFMGPNIGGPAPTIYSVDPQTNQLPGYLISFITLIKIGHISSGGQIPPGSIIKATVKNHGDMLVWSDILERPLVVNLQRPTCVVNTPNFTVDLGEVSISDFDPSGRTSPKNFSIDLTCTGGTKSADVHVTLTDANNPGNTSSQLGLSPDSDARGIALEVHNQFGVVNFGPDLNGIGNPGQWLDGAVGVGSYSIPLSVNYVRLPGPIKGGSANSGVTYTLNYD